MTNPIDPLAKFRSFSRADRIWVFVGLALIVIVLNIVFAT